ncbi:MAG: hypothetical protein IKJ55_07355 [Clostridia bacterium]|nr:hypothetical protein [Clostridia bacterium]
MQYKNNKTKEISFPLGGIGTGCIGLAGNGRLIDWEIFNKPAKGSMNGYSHFAVRAIDGEKITAAVLNGDIESGYMGQYSQSYFRGYGFGPFSQTMCGFPHFKNVVFNGEFPVASLDFEGEQFPADINMVAFNPFIPTDSKNSSLPGGFFEIVVKNTSDKKLKYQIALSVQNPYESSLNKSEVKDGIHAVTLYNNGAEKDSIEYGDLTIATDCEVAYTQTYWYRGGWQDSIVSFWNNFSQEKDIMEREYAECGKFDHATLVAELEIEPNATKTAKFILSWNVPYNYNYWAETEDAQIKKPWKNYYATVFENSLDTAVYALSNWETLYTRTMQFKNALHGSTLPKEAIDAASANLSVLKSPTVLRLEDGSFYGWEGVHEQAGSCEGTCQHVWNYAYAMCFLFPDLERSIRDMEFKYSTDENGKMGFRIMLPLGRDVNAFRACVDGQMGAVIKCYREWKISGDNVWLKANWENIKKVLEYAWSPQNPDGWDLNKDGVLEGRQHHTLDMELFGPSSWLEGMYLLALKAASEMALFLGDTAKAKEYADLFEKGYKWTKDNLFNGKYFIQRVDFSDKNEVDKYGADDYWNAEAKQIKYQIAEGSSIDQMLAQWHSDIIGLGDIYDSAQIDIALSEMMKNNYKESMRFHTNPWRIFSLNDEAGSIICAYPEGADKPKIPVPYCEETMTGFEYSFAGLLCARGKVADGLKVVEAVRDRFDGEKRNPFNEFECGSNYARSMASYALLPILSGFEFDMPNGHIGFNPYKKGNFNCIWSVANAWGNVKISQNKVLLNLYSGKLNLKSLGLKFCTKISSLKIDGKKVDFTFENGILNFKEITILSGVEIDLS